MRYHENALVVHSVPANLLLSLHPSRHVFQLLDAIAFMLQATGDKFDRPAVHAFLDSLMDLEHEIPGSCEVLVGRLLHRLGRCDHHYALMILRRRLTLCIYLKLIMAHNTFPAAQRIPHCKVSGRRQCPFSLRNLNLPLNKQATRN